MQCSGRLLRPEIFPEKCPGIEKGLYGELWNLKRFVIKVDMVLTS